MLSHNTHTYPTISLDLPTFLQRPRNMAQRHQTLFPLRASGHTPKQEIKSGLHGRLECGKLVSCPANEIEERARNLLLIVVGYVTDRSRSQKQLSLTRDRSPPPISPRSVYTQHAFLLVGLRLTTTTLGFSHTLVQT